MNALRSLLLLSLTLPAFSAQSASFDCAKASQPDEIAICANPSLNDKDVKLSTKYHFLTGLVAMGARGAMQDEQRDWLQRRRQCGDNVPCLEALYDERLRQLDALYDEIEKPL